ncbi:PE family protein, partial [Mycobacterium pseudokansasii]|uniref:PE family protein n=2 Tax=Mycobacterium pseudokansasii TaxID=2341080 RepID=UPI0010A96979
MSFVVSSPEMLAAAAGDLATIGSTVSAANAAARVPTLGVLAAGTDEVSAAIAALLGAHAQVYQAVGAQAKEFYSQYVQTLTAAAGSYASAEAANVSPLGNLLGVINARTQTLTGRPLIGNGANGAPGTGQDGAPGGWLLGDGGAGGSGAPSCP